MNNTASFIKRTTDKLGFRRDFYVEKNIPEVMSNIVIIPFYADIRSTFILSSFLFNQYKRANSDKYIIVCSWTGWQKMFPYADEFWSLTDRSQIRGLVDTAASMSNNSATNNTLTRNLLQHFENVVLYESLQEYYKDGFKAKYIKEFGSIRYWLPEVPASNILGKFSAEIANKQGKKVVLYPVKNIRAWQQGKCHYRDISKNFWSYVIEKLLSEDLIPVLYQNSFTFDMSPEFTDRCLYLVNEDISHVLAAFREIGCVLDIHSGISRLAIAARCPFIVLDERIRYINQRDYEIDDICCDGIRKLYSFSLAGMLMSGSPKEWDASFMDSFITKIHTLLESFKKEDLISTAEIDEDVSSDKIRNRASKRLGVKFIAKSK